MKKLLLVCGLALIGATAYGQGEVNFANSSTTLIRTNGPSGTGGMSGAGQYRIGLYVGDLGSAESSLTLVTPTALNSPLAGRFNGNPAGGFYQIPGRPTGQTITFQVRAWSAANGASYEEGRLGSTGWIGTSAVGSTTLGGGLITPGSIFGTDPGAVGGFDMTPVPEPSSIALGLLGLGAIALFRRRK